MKKLPLKIFDVLIAFLILIVFFLPKQLFADQTNCKQFYRIGVVLPLTAGPVFSGEVIKNSILLAKKRFDLDDCVQFLFEDDQFQPKNTVTAVSRLIETEKVDGVIVYGTPTALAVNERLEREKIPMIALSILDQAHS